MTIWNMAKWRSQQRPRNDPADSEAFSLTPNAGTPITDMQKDVEKLQEMFKGFVPKYGHVDTLEVRVPVTILPTPVWEAKIVAVKPECQVAESIRREAEEIIKQKGGFEFL